MMKYLVRNTALVLVMLFCGMFILNSGVAFAGSPSYNGVDCSGAAAQSPVCHAGTTDPLTGSNGVIVKATNVLALVAGIAAVIIIIIAGIHFITSNGDPNAAGSARSTIIMAAVGIVVIVLAKSIITFIVSRV